jgi:hypothetical protein
LDYILKKYLKKGDGSILNIQRIHLKFRDNKLLETGDASGRKTEPEWLLSSGSRVLPAPRN